MLEENHKVFFILLSIRTDKCPEKKYEHIVKYLSSMRTAFKDYTSEKQKVTSIENLSLWFSDTEKIRLNDFGSADLGTAFDVRVFLDYFLIN